MAFLWLGDLTCPSVRARSRRRTCCSRAEAGGTGSDDQKGDSNKASFGYVGPRKIGIAFTCTRCDTRMVKQISRKAYQDGVVIIQCSGCYGRHIIADNLGWYSELTNNKKNIEELAEANGETVRRITDEKVFEMEKNLYGRGGRELIVDDGSSDDGSSDDGSTNENTGES
eukprot:CAMPEP_0198733412 /NCGR_PEP_ID=MMETSP1475-20131203/45636_1 /TAXON_ID= ORGANISM="Unidentified sp., Strain CCMP1999" /NCGR_SAMPLE_ID=MMETSP1475 /ASSEMBLY_ACC=CAM_ASM_001111 /LENGTH=169 /DNA_ID=CAMNT_0044496707 /DNA_START=72 /DNA_END=581 /DNA_ORIENTATION=+